MKLHKIDIKTYDAVIGPEYVHGGKQLCILSKQGVGVRLQARIRALLRPEAWGARLARTAAKWKTLGAEHIAFIRRASAIVVANGIGLLFGYLQSLALEHFNQRILTERLQSLEPEVLAYVEARHRMLLDYALEGKTYIATTVRLAYLYSWQEDETGGGQSGFEGGILGEVKIDSFNFSHKDFNGRTPGQPQINREWTGPKGFRTGYIEYELYTFSSELAPAKESVDLYRTYMDTSKWYQDALKDPALTDQDRLNLRKERDALWDFVDATFGTIGQFRPNPKFWTDDGLARMR